MKITSLIRIPVLSSILVIGLAACSTLPNKPPGLGALKPVDSASPATLARIRRQVDALDDKGTNTDASIKIADEFFGSYSVVGKSESWALENLGDPYKKGRYYWAPFYPVDDFKSHLVYRYDNGRFGTQVNLKLNENRVITQQTTLGIE